MPDQMQDESFYTLTPDTVLEAADRAGLKPTGHCMQLNSLENRVYDLKLEDESHVVAKFYRPGRWSRLQILEEHSFLHELAGAEIPVIQPLPFPDGHSVQSAGNIFFSVFPRRGGRAPDELNDRQLISLGRFVARMHNAGSAKAYNHRYTLNETTYITKPFEYLKTEQLIPDQHLSLFEDCVSQLTEIYREVSRNVPLIRIHGDCHKGNLLYGDDGYFFLDFDDTLTGPAVQDLWLLIPERDADGIRQRQIFLEGYRQFREFEDSWLNLVEPLRTMRYIHYCAWLAKRRTDPAFIQAFPDFNTEQYWADETSDLSDQIRYILRNSADMPHSVQPHTEAEEEELTNADFFWDWEE